MEAKDGGVQADVAKAFSKIIPDAANVSRFGVVWL